MQFFWVEAFSFLPQVQSDGGNLPGQRYLGQLGTQPALDQPLVIGLEGTCVAARQGSGLEDLFQIGKERQRELRQEVAELPEARVTRSKANHLA